VGCCSLVVVAVDASAVVAVDASAVVAGAGAGGRVVAAVAS
jgi:hypothetical protein